LGTALFKIKAVLNSAYCHDIAISVRFSTKPKVKPETRAEHLRRARKFRAAGCKKPRSFRDRRAGGLFALPDEWHDT
jgi:hypothetical protein